MPSVAASRLSPGRRQYLELKRRHSDALLLFRIGDFYEAFDDDAKRMASVLEITLTARDVGGGVKAPLAGIPVHALQGRLKRLVDAGLKVAVAEQTSDPSSSRGLLERQVTRVFTAGTLTDPQLLHADRSNFLATICVAEQQAGIAWIELSTAEFVTAQMPLDDALDELARLQPAELIVDRTVLRLLKHRRWNFVVRPTLTHRPSARPPADRLLQHFGTQKLDSFGCSELPLAIEAAAQALDYVIETQVGSVEQLVSLRTLRPERFVKLDARALCDLEILTAMTDGGSSLYDCVNYTTTPMGARLLRGWLARPLAELEPLNMRHKSVASLLAKPVHLAELRAELRHLGDIERLGNRLRSFAINPRDLQALANGLDRVPTIAKILTKIGSMPHINGLTSLDKMVAQVATALASEAPLTVGDGNTIKAEWDRNLDELRSLATGAQASLAKLEIAERARSGIKSLKVGYSRVFGYHIEVSKTNLARVPDNYIRKQTLANAERFTIAELSRLEADILRARGQMEVVERDAYRRLCEQCAQAMDSILVSASTLADVDALCSLAEAARQQGWVRPTVDNSLNLSILGGCHPQVQKALGPNRFVPNDVDIDPAKEQILVLTGPNMSGKSTYIRMVAILVLLAQIGSYLPAKRARIGLIDRIFTRTGASDDIVGGNSTFMTEMLETATVLNQATPRSLAVMDEIGRGTSTYDGLAIAQAVVEYIHNSPRHGFRTLFATHYHELTELADHLKRVGNRRVEVAEKDGEPHFMHRIVEGASDRSYGIHVARLAGIPATIVERAKRILERLERRGDAIGYDAARIQLALPTDEPHPPVENHPDDQLERLCATIGELNLDTLTPLEALNRLADLQQKARQLVTCRGFEPRT